MLHRDHVTVSSKRPELRTVQVPKYGNCGGKSRAHLRGKPKEKKKKLSDF